MQTGHMSDDDTSPFSWKSTVTIESYERRKNRGCGQQFNILKLLQRDEILSWQRYMPVSCLGTGRIEGADSYYMSIKNLLYVYYVSGFYDTQLNAEQRKCK